MQVIHAAILGLATGAIYALVAIGLVLIYRGSGVLNFGQGAIAMFAAYVYYELTARGGLAKAPAVAVVLLACAALGALIHLGLLRTMTRRAASPLARVIATLSVLLILQSAALLIYGAYPKTLSSLLPTTTVHLLSDDLQVTLDRLLIVGICLCLGAALYAVYRWTAFGRITAAVAESEVSAASFGYSPDVIAAANWALGSMLAGIAGILIAPITFLEPTGLTLLVVPAMAVALLAGFSSFPVLIVSGFALGVAQSEISRYVGGVGWATAAPFLVVIAFLVVRGRALPLRGYVLERAPRVGTGRVRLLPVAVLWAAGVWVVGQLDPTWSAPLVTTFGVAIIGLSIVVLTGYAGQLSLAQYVIAGLGALIAARLAAEMGLIPAVVLAVLGTGVAGALIGLPALRTRGATLAVVTLCLASAVMAVVFQNPQWSGGMSGIVVPSLSLLGWSIDPVLRPDRYAVVALTLLVALALAVANVRAGVTGRRLLAVRSNERAAASLGVPVAGMKVYAFFLSAAIAALGGILLAFVQPTVQPSTFDVFTCVLLVGLAVVGGIGYVSGALICGLLVTGGVLAQALSAWPSVNEYFPLIGACGLAATLLTGPDGVAVGLSRALAPVGTALDRLPRWRGAAARERPIAPTARVGEQALVVAGLSKAFGGVRAIDDVSIEVRPGEVHGLIGPNGAGKTTLIDVVTGMVRADAGLVRLGDHDVTRWSARRRSLQGLSRSFQSLELFDDLTVEENLAVASQPRELARCAVDLVWPGRVALSPAAWAAVDSFELRGLLGAYPTEIAFGQRKLVAIARAIAGAPSILLLDEPAAGLGDHEADELAGVIRSLATEWRIGVLLVEHKVDLIMSLSDRITALDAGRVIAAGAPLEVQADAEVLGAYLGAVSA